VYLIWIENGGVGLHSPSDDTLGLRAIADDDIYSLFKIAEESDWDRYEITPDHIAQKMSSFLASANDVIGDASHELFIECPAPLREALSLEFERYSACDWINKFPKN
jgi:hypothetical protein